MLARLTPSTCGHPSADTATDGITFANIDESTALAAPPETRVPFCPRTGRSTFETFKFSNTRSENNQEHR
ncbi:MAG: hypothetical protein R3B91_17360 [Planctomycetaceae bacterium]